MGDSGESPARRRRTRGGEAVLAVIVLVAGMLAGGVVPANAASAPTPRVAGAFAPVAAVTVSAAAARASAESGKVLTSTNTQRARAKVPALARSAKLVSLACAWASKLAGSRKLVHSTAPSGFRAWGENIAMGYGTSSSVMKAWMASPGHKKNILHRGYTKMGSCSAVASNGTRYWVQQFGS